MSEDICRDGTVHFDLGASDPWDDDFPELIFHRVNSADIVYETRPRVPKFIGSYLLGDVLGEGSYARVKEALETTTLRRAAVKIMKKKKLKKIPSGEDNVRREIQLIQKLSLEPHPNIIELYHVHYRPEKQKTYLFMTFCCCSLQDMLDNTTSKQFPTWQAHEYISQTLQGLHFLHSRGIVHKDIKPANLLLAPDLTIKLCDFGVAEELDPYRQDDTLRGSQGAPMFQPPEIATGRDTFSGFKLDVWSTGVSLYNFVTGEYPFNAENVWKLYLKIGEGKYTVPDHLSPSLASLLKGMLDIDYNTRLSIDSVLQHEWIVKKHPRSYEQDEVTIPNNVAEESTLLPFLQQLHADEDPVPVHHSSTHHSSSEPLTSSNDDSLVSAPIRNVSNVGNTSGTEAKATTKSCKVQ